MSILLTLNFPGHNPRQIDRPLRMQPHHDKSILQMLSKRQFLQKRPFALLSKCLVRRIAVDVVADPRDYPLMPFVCFQNQIGPTEGHVCLLQRRICEVALELRMGDWCDNKIIAISGQCLDCRAKIVDEGLIQSHHGTGGHCGVVIRIDGKGAVGNYIGA